MRPISMHFRVILAVIAERTLLAMEPIDDWNDGLRA
jgi:hypothetical protein